MANVQQLTDEATVRAAGKTPRVLLLQGPVGPFFRRLQRSLEARGADVTRVLFNSGDELFGPNKNAVRFSGDIESWHRWVEERFEQERPDTIILFGAKRPAHRIAREIAAREGIEVLSLEEGYLRSGYVTCEVGANNDLSPICGRVPEPGEDIDAPSSAKLGSSFRIMGVWGFLYYGHRILFTPETDEPLIHRPLRSAIPEGIFWLRNVWRLMRSRISESGIIRRLTTDFDQDYFLVPLQMPSDSQMGAAARGWNIERLVDASIRSFAKTGHARRLVFKLHPLDGHAPLREARVREIAEAHGVADQIVVVHSGSIAKLAIHSKGMIVINSTSGMTAIHHGAPLLVMGEAVFRHPSLVHCGNDESDIDAFMANQFVADLETRRAYEDFLTREALLPGDFYGRRGRKIAAASIADRVVGVEGHS